MVGRYLAGGCKKIYAEREDWLDKSGFAVNTAAYIYGVFKARLSTLFSLRSLFFLLPLGKFSLIDYRIKQYPLDNWC